MIQRRFTARARWMHRLLWPLLSLGLAALGADINGLPAATPRTPVSPAAVDHFTPAAPQAPLPLRGLTTILQPEATGRGPADAGRCPVDEGLALDRRGLPTAPAPGAATASGWTRRHLQRAGRTGHPGTGPPAPS